MKYTKVFVPILLALIIGACAKPPQHLTLEQNKPEIDAALKAYADVWSKANQVTVTVKSVGGSSGIDLGTQLKADFAAGDMPDIFAFDGLQTYQQWADLILDLSGEPWVKNTSVAFKFGGKVYGFPVAVEGWGLAYNADILKKAGVDPRSWKNLDAMFADFPKIRKAGVIPLAIGAQPWQLEYLLGSCIVYYSGDLYDKVFGLNPDKAAFDSPAMRQALALYRRIQQEADPGSANRNWNDTTAMVIRGDALMQFHGDWMKGEFNAAGKKLGVDYDTEFPPGTKGVQVTIDAETFLHPNDAIKQNSEEAFFNIMLQKGITEKFSVIKGSTPVRLDASVGIDKHAKMVLAAIADPKFGHPVRNITMDDDFAGAYMALADNFWNTPSMTADDFIKQLQQKYDQILGK